MKNIMETLNIKNRIKRAASYSLITASLILASSCENALQEDVISQIGTEYLNTPKGIEDAVNAAYSTMRIWYGTEIGNNLTEFGTDIYTNGADGAWKFMNTYTNQFDTRNGHVRELWDELYRGINTSNSVIDRAPEVSGLSEDVRSQRIAEAKFIRAHQLFSLSPTFWASRTSNE